MLFIRQKTTTDFSTWALPAQQHLSTMTSTCRTAGALQSAASSAGSFCQTIMQICSNTSVRESPSMTCSLVMHLLSIILVFSKHSRSVLLCGNILARRCLSRLGGITPSGTLGQCRRLRTAHEVSADKLYRQTLSINHNWANASCLAGMYNALANQVEQSIELMDDLRPPPQTDNIKGSSALQAGTMSHAEFYEMIYNNLVRPNWGWSFVEFWDMVGWILDNPEGGPRWRLDACTSINPVEVRECVCELAQKWLERKEASWLHALRVLVESILYKTQRNSCKLDN